jgi:hypothetical protein
VSGTATTVTDTSSLTGGESQKQPTPAEIITRLLYDYCCCLAAAAGCDDGAAAGTPPPVPLSPLGRVVTARIGSQNCPSPRGPVERNGVSLDSSHT